MKQYDSYKDSGTPWIGQIPSHWEEKRMRFVCDYQKGKNPSNLSFDFETGMLPYLSMDYLRESTDNTQYTFPENDFVLCEDGDFLLLWDGSNAGEFLHSKKGVLCSTCAKLFPKGHSEKYFEYVCKSVQHYLQDMTNGMGIPHVDANVFKNLRTLVPPISEQEAIASYLDKKCSSIDKIIATQEKRIALLGELKQSIITEAVTRGLNPDAPLKDSGIDWIGKIPEHWDRKRIKFFIDQHSDGIWGDDEKGNSDDIACFRVADFDYEHMGLRNENPTLRNIPLQQVQDRIIQKGDLLLEKSGGGEISPVGRVVINNNDIIAVCSNFIHYLRIESSTNHRYICYYFKFLYSNKINLLFFNQTTGIQNLNIHDYLGQTIYLPKLSEQKQIVDYLDAKCARIDKSITKAKREVELLREYKQTIITEAVTGKIKVC